MCHFYDESPVVEFEQRARLQIPVTLLEAGIHHVVYGEDALGIVHRVPTCLFSLQLLVAPENISRTAELICSRYPYSFVDPRDADCWRDFSFPGMDRVYAFNGSNTTLLRAIDVDNARDNYEPSHILVHAASVYHFDIHDPTRTMLNPAPPDDASKSILFPTVSAFYDSLIDTYHEPPLQTFNRNFIGWLRMAMGYLSLYTVSDKGVRVQGGKLIPSCGRALQEAKEEKRPYLSRKFFSLPNLDHGASTYERDLIKAHRCEREGIVYKPRTAAQFPWLRPKPVLSRSELIQLIDASRACNPALSVWSWTRPSCKFFSTFVHRATRP